MVLVDSSLWIEHLRRPVPALLRLLEARRVATHPFVVGELACGRIEPRAVLLADLQKLRTVPRATDDEALALIENHSLMGRGIGYVAFTYLHRRCWPRTRDCGASIAHLRAPRPVYPFPGLPDPTMKYRVARRRSEEGFSGSVPGLPGCGSEGATEDEALAPIQSAIEYLNARDVLLHGAETREVEVAV